MLLYLVGHGLVKGALFMVTGILLATRAGIDEIALRGLGRGIEPAGIAMALGGLLLCGLPLGLLDQGTRVLQGALLDGGHPITLAATVIGAGLTGAAVLRAAGRIFLGLGPDPGDEAQAPSEAEREKANRPLWLMLAPCLVLLTLNLAAPDAAIARLATVAVPAFVHRHGDALGHGSAWLPWSSLALALTTAAYALGRHRLPHRLFKPIHATQSVPSRLLEQVHGGLIGDYVTWLVVGLAVWAGLLAIAS